MIVGFDSAKKNVEYSTISEILSSFRSVISLSIVTSFFRLRSALADRSWSPVEKPGNLSILRAFRMALQSPFHDLRRSIFLRGADVLSTCCSYVGSQLFRPGPRRQLWLLVLPHTTTNRVPSKQTGNSPASCCHFMLALVTDFITLVAEEESR